MGFLEKFFKVKEGADTTGFALEKRYKVDFVKIRDKNIDLENVEVYFPFNTSDIVVNGKRRRFDAYKVDETVWSSDNKYQRIITNDFVFWIKPRDYKSLKDIMMRRQKEYLKNR
nr:hypothetical protein [Clostridium chromiireducens]